MSLYTHTIYMYVQHIVLWAMHAWKGESQYIVSAWLACNTLCHHFQRLLTLKAN